MDSGKHAEGRQTGIVRSFVGFLLMIALVFGLTWFLHTFLIQPYRIPSGSMEDTIEIGDMVLAEKVSYAFGEPEPGQIVTFEDPQIPSRTLIKRCIATGGQTVDLVDGFVVVDGVVLDEPYTEGKPSEPLSNSSIVYPYTVPDGYIWVMGDNRTNSQDSRYFGAIPVVSVTGHAVVTYWPIDHIGLLS